MISCNEIRAFKLLPTTISELSKELGVNPGSASKITEKLVKNGLAAKERQGKNVIITKEKTIHSQKLEEIIKLFPRLPIERLLTHSNLILIASLTYPLNAEEIRRILGVTRPWVYKTIKQLSTFGIILKTRDGYTINPAHRKLQEFSIYYCEFRNYHYISALANDAIILWQHGNEFLFTTKQDIDDISTTAVTAFSQYDLPLLSNVKYYYRSKRAITTTDIILHTILIDPTSKTYNAYACLLYEKTTPPDIVKKARLYNLTNHIQTLLSYLKNHATQEKFLPSWEEYEALAKQYGVR